MNNHIKLGILAAINIALTFFTTWFFIFYSGVNIVADAYTASTTIPLYLIIISTAFTTVLIPVLSKYDTNNFNNQIWSYLHINFLFFGAITIILISTANIWVKLILPGFSTAQLKITIDLTKIQLIALFFTSFVTILTLANTLRHKFYWIETSSIFANLIAIVFIFFTVKKWNIYSIAWGVALRGFFQLVFLIPIIGKYTKPKFIKEDIKSIKKNIVPLLLGSAVYKTDTIIDRFFISGSSIGIITLLSLAQQMYGVGNSIITKVLINPTLPILSKFYNKKEWGKYFEYFKKRNKELLIFTSLIGIVVIAAGIFVYNVNFSFLKFNHESLKNLSLIAIILLGYWVGGVVGNFTANSFYIRGDVKTPTNTSIVNFIFFIIYKIFLFKYFGYIGLVFSISIYYIASILMHYYFINKFKNNATKNY